MSRRRALGKTSLVLAGFFAVVAACAGDPGSNGGDGPVPEGPDAGDPTPEPRYPVPDWAPGDPADHGLEAGDLERAAAAAERLDSYCLLVVRDGALVFERYFNGAGPDSVNRSWSIAKSYAGTLIGIAIDRGDIASLDDPVADYVPEWAGTDRAAITVRDIVSMTSGLEWSAFQDYGQMATLSSDQTEFALGLDLDVPPGSDWTYHNGGVQIIEPLIRNAAGVSLAEYAERHLWSRVGMSATWATDRSDNPTAYANVMTTCRDHARFGYLYLRGGAWAGGEQVVSTSWIDEALEPSQGVNRGYGHLFWLNGEAPVRSPLNEDRDEILVPFAPDDLFAARGFGNQFIDVIPSLDLVVVRLGADPATSFDLGVLIDDARFDKHAEILEPILDATR